MERHISCLVEACTRLALNYEFIDNEKNFVRVRIQDRWEYFEVNKTPLNTEVEYGICKDKMHSYELLNKYVNMPKTIPFLDFEIEEKYKKYLAYDSIESALSEIEVRLDYPAIIKPNKGALGSNVYFCENHEQVASSFSTIFNKKSKDYDYIALAQQFIYQKFEYRLVCVHGNPFLLYQRGSGGRRFNAKYWEAGEVANLIDDEPLTQELFDFVKPVFTQIRLGLVGFDIIRDKNDELYLIELNSSPKFDHVIEGGGRDQVVEVYVEVLKSLG